jgi:hypothetical protein
MNSNLVKITLNDKRSLSKVSVGYMQIFGRGRRHWVLINSKESVLQNENEASSITRIYFFTKVITDVVTHFEYGLLMYQMRHLTGIDLEIYRLIQFI